MQAKKNNKTANTNKPAAVHEWHGVRCHETPDGVTLTITGAAFRNLKKITRIFNKWDATNHTPADMIWKECFSPSAMLMALGESCPECDKGETLPGVLCDTFRKAPDVTELAAAFKAAGFAV